MNALFDSREQVLYESLIRIFELGDEDECSWKHLGHGFAALLAFEDYLEAVDYSTPFGREATELELEELDKQWRDVNIALDGLTIEQKIELAEKLQASDGRLMYLGVYITASFLDYAQPINERKAKW